MNINDVSPMPDNPSLAQNASDEQLILGFQDISPMSTSPNEPVLSQHSSARTQNLSTDDPSATEKYTTEQLALRIDDVSPVCETDADEGVTEQLLPRSQHNNPDDGTALPPDRDISQKTDNMLEVDASALSEQLLRKLLRDKQKSKKQSVINHTSCNKMAASDEPVSDMTDNMLRRKKAIEQLVKNNLIEDSEEKNIPRQMAVLIHGIDDAIMLNLLIQYGSVPYQKVFNKFSLPLALSSWDAGCLEGYQKANQANPNPNKEDQSFLNEHIFDYAVKKLSSEEERACLIDDLTSADAAKNEGIKVGTEIYNREYAPTSTSDLPDVLLVDRDPEISNLNTSHKPSLQPNSKTFLETFGLERTSTHRASYFLDHWGCSKQNKGREVELSAVLNQRREPQDSSFLEYNGSCTTSMVHTVAKNVLYHILGLSNDSTCDVDTLRFATGLIKSGGTVVHQDLHVDDVKVMNGTIMKNNMNNKVGDITPKEWLHTGYVIDMPLSKQGSWLRVGIACPKDNEGEMTPDYIYIPFGSMLLRSTTLFHGGHFGSPGNTSFHGSLHDPNYDIDTKNVHYLRDMKDTKMGKWKLNCTTNVLQTRIKKSQLKRRGCLRFNKLLERYQFEQQNVILAIVNPFDESEASTEAFISKVYNGSDRVAVRDS